MSTIIYVDQNRPRIVSSFQAKTALADAGLLAAVQSMIDDPATPIKVKLAWQEGLDFRSDNPMVLSIIDALSLTEAEKTALFDAAALVDPNQL